MASSSGTILIIGASRGIGLGLVEAYLALGWQVIATVRDTARAPALAALRLNHADQLRIEALEVTDAGQAAALARSLAGVRLDVLFVVAGMSGHFQTPLVDIPNQDAAQEFLVNALAPVAVADRLIGLVKPGGVVAFMTSILGSIGSNAGGGMELYRASKAALNMLGACFALRHKSHPVALLHPGWVRTDMGGAQAPLDVATSAAGLVRVIDGRQGKPGIAYLDYQGQTLPW